MINFNWVIISSDNKREMLYIFSLLNSPLNKFVLESLLKTEKEKAINVGIKKIKEFVRVPKISDENQYIKNEIIGQTKEMLKLEDVKLKDLVDFKNILLQKYDNVTVEKIN